MALAALPSELIDIICIFLQEYSHLANLCLTSKRLYLQARAKRRDCFRNYAITWNAALSDLTTNRPFLLEHLRQELKAASCTCTITAKYRDGNQILWLTLAYGDWIKLVRRSKRSHGDGRSLLILRPPPFSKLCCYRSPNKRWCFVETSGAVDGQQAWWCSEEVRSQKPCNSKAMGFLGHCVVESSPLKSVYEPTFNENDERMRCLKDYVQWLDACGEDDADGFYDDCEDCWHPGSYEYEQGVSREVLQYRYD